MHIVHTYLTRQDAANLHLQDCPSVTLTLAERRRCRQRLVLDDQEDHVGMAIERGTTLRDGDVLVTQDGLYIQVKAALEDVVRVTADSPWQLARAAYHLGNRHVLLEVDQAGYLQFEYDAILMDMLEQLGGVAMNRVQAIFEPDVGAYGGGHRHGHDETFDEDYALAQQAYHTHEPGHDAASAVHDHKHGAGQDHHHHTHEQSHTHDHKQGGKQ